MPSTTPFLTNPSSLIPLRLSSYRTTKNTFCPRRTRRTRFLDPRRDAKNTFLSTKDHEEHLLSAEDAENSFLGSAKGREKHLFIHEGPRRTPHCPRRTRRTRFLDPRSHAKGHEEHLLSAEDAEDPQGVSVFCAAAPPLDGQAQFAPGNRCSAKRQQGLKGLKSSAASPGKRDAAGTAVSGRPAASIGAVFQGNSQHARVGLPARSGQMKR